MRHAMDFEQIERAGLDWTGRSGRRYLLARVETADAVLSKARLYALVDDGTIRWAGTAEDLIADQVSRARFRRAVAEGAHMFFLGLPEDPLAAMTLAWDLEGSHGEAGRDAA